MLTDYWTVLYVGVVSLLVLLEAVQLSKSFGSTKVNILQFLVYIGIIATYWMGIGKGGSFGIFLRVTSLVFFLLFLLEIISFPKDIEEKKQKLLLVLLSILKLAPLVLIIMKLTEAYM